MRLKNKRNIFWIVINVNLHCIMPNKLLILQLVAQVSEQLNGQLSSRTTSIENIIEIAEKLLENVPFFLYHYLNPIVMLPNIYGF